MGLSIRIAVAANKCDLLFPGEFCLRQGISQAFQCTAVS
jgi:hypothetical protein